MSHDLQDLNESLGITECRLQKMLPHALRNALPAIEDWENVLEQGDLDGG